MDYWGNHFWHIARSILPFCRRDFNATNMLGRLRNQHRRGERKVGTKLLDQLGIRPEYQFLVDRIGMARVDDLYFEFITRHELVWRIDVAAGVGLVDESGLLLLGIGFDDLAPGHDRLD